MMVEEVGVLMHVEVTSTDLAKSQEAKEESLGAQREVLGGPANWKQAASRGSKGQGADQICAVALRLEGQAECV